MCSPAFPQLTRAPLPRKPGPQLRSVCACRLLRRSGSFDESDSDEEPPALMEGPEYQAAIPALRGVPEEPTDAELQWVSRPVAPPAAFGPAGSCTPVLAPSPGCAALARRLLHVCARAQPQLPSLISPWRFTPVLVVGLGRAAELLRLTGALSAADCRLLSCELHSWLSSCQGTPAPMDGVPAAVHGKLVCRTHMVQLPGHAARQLTTSMAQSLGMTRMGLSDALDWRTSEIGALRTDLTASSDCWTAQQRAGPCLRPWAGLSVVPLSGTGCFALRLVPVPSCSDAAHSLSWLDVVTHAGSCTVYLCVLVHPDP